MSSYPASDKHAVGQTTAHPLILHDSWKSRLLAEFQQPYMQELRQFLVQRKALGERIYPAGAHYFAALDATPFEQVKVVILGQDPYHGPGQAHGLSFSVPAGVPHPPSLQNIFKELHDDVGVPRPEQGCLLGWARQGVLLLNSVLTVTEGQAASHAGRGWERLTDRIIALLNEQRSGLVFVLWGAYAQKKAAFVDRQRHAVLSAPHPSPLSAHRGFMGSRPFSKINAYLQAQNQEPIDWARINE